MSASWWWSALGITSAERHGVERSCSSGWMRLSRFFRWFFIVNLLWASVTTRVCSQETCTQMVRLA